MSAENTELNNTITDIPHDQVFSSRETTQVRTRLRVQSSYEVSIKSSKPSCTLLICIPSHRDILICSKGGKYRNKLNLTEEMRQRHAGSNKAECPFKLAARFNGTAWTIDVLESNVSDFALKKTLDTLRHVKKSPITPLLHVTVAFNAFTAFPVASTPAPTRPRRLPCSRSLRQPVGIDNKSFAVCRPKETSVDSFEQAIERLQERQKTLNAFERTVRLSPCHTPSTSSQPSCTTQQAISMPPFRAAIDTAVPRVDPQSAGLRRAYPAVESWAVFFSDNLYSAYASS